MTETTLEELTSARWRGRSRVQIERDVLCAALLIEPFRKRVRALLTRFDFTTAAHDALWTMLSMQHPTEIIDANVAMATGCTIEDAERWVLGSSPVTYDEDAALLVSLR